MARAFLSAEGAPEVGVRAARHEVDRRESGGGQRSGNGRGYGQEAPGEIANLAVY